jgi:hypothetical protein
MQEKVRERNLRSAPTDRILTSAVIEWRTSETWISGSIGLVPLAGLDNWLPFVRRLVSIPLISMMYFCFHSGSSMVVNTYNSLDFVRKGEPSHTMEYVNFTWHC